ncbi:MAG: hypothetical protein ACTHU0_31690 [Kofleriaceae bacterium]
MRRRARPLIAALGLLGALGLSGCDRGLGAPCARHTDCLTGYCAADGTCSMRASDAGTDGAELDADIDAPRFPSTPDGDLGDDLPDAAPDALDEGL